MRPELNSILMLDVPLIVELGRCPMNVQRVLSLLPGSIIELPKTDEEDLDLLVNNKRIGSGTAVKVGENFGIRITQIGEVAARLEAAADVSVAPGSSPSDEPDPDATEPLPEAGDGQEAA